MTDLSTIWASTQADDGFDKNPPPAGALGIARVSGSRVGTSKAGESYFAIDLVDDSQGYNWGIYKEFTKNGQPHEGRIKSAKITLRQVGLDVADPSLLAAALGQIEGRFFAYEAVASKDINRTTGAPYVNYNITGPASAPTLNVAQPAPAPQVQAPQFAGPTLDQALTGAAAMQQQVQQAVAQPGVDQHPWQ